MNVCIDLPGLQPAGRICEIGGKGRGSGCLPRQVSTCQTSKADDLALAPAPRGRQFNHTNCRTAEALEKARKLEARVASDEDLKQSDQLRLWARESQVGLTLGIILNLQQK